MSLGPNPQADPFNKTWENEVFSQPFNLTNAYGEVVTFDLGILDSFMRYIGDTLIVCGIAFGMCFILIIVLLLLTKPEKRRTPVFIFNLVSLVLMALRMLSSCIQQNGPLANLSSSLLGTSLIPASDIANQTLYAVLTALWYAITLVSMILQVRVVFSAEPKLQNVVTGSLSLLALATMGTLLPPDIETIITTQNLTFALPPWYDALQHAANVTWAVTIGCASLVFVAKLLYIISRRKKMGFKGFGPLQVITIMAVQCLVIPLIFVILSFYVQISGFVVIGEAALTCSLPLSAVWASFEASKLAPSQGVASLGPLSTASSAGVVECAPSSKRSFFRRWRGSSSRGTASDDQSDVMEKGSFTDDSDHVMIQKTLHVSTTESPTPGSSPKTFGF